MFVNRAVSSRARYGKTEFAGDVQLLVVRCNLSFSSFSTTTSSPFVQAMELSKYARSQGLFPLFVHIILSHVFWW